MWRDRDPFDHARVAVDGILQDIEEERQHNRRRAATLQPGDPLHAGSRPARGTGMAPAPRVPSGPRPPAPVQATTAEPFRIALNQPRCYAWTTTGAGAHVTFEHNTERYGPPLRSLGDGRELGVTIFRHVGDVDLTWPCLSFDLDALIADYEAGSADSVMKLSGVGLQVPHWRVIEGVTSRMATGGPGVPETEIIHGTTIHRMVNLLAEAHRQGVKLILTFLHYANGGAGYTGDMPDEVRRKHGDDDVAYGTLDGSTEYTSSSGRAVGDLDREHRRLRWSADHVGATIKDPELPDTWYDFPQAVADDTVGRPPHLEVLDPWCPYKRQVIRRLASMAATLLADVVDARLRATVDGYTGLGDVIYGIELFNEVDHAASSLRASDGSGGFDMTATGEAWGRTCFHAAKGLRHILPASTGIKILMPGLSSYHNSLEEDETWEGRLAFVQGLAGGFAGEFRSRAEELSVDEDEWKLANIVDLFQGMDIHNYHFRNALAERPVHCGLLGFELGLIRAAVVAGMQSAVSDDDDAAEQAALFAELPLTVIETTTTAVGPGASDVCGSYKPGDTPWSALSFDQYQAWEVWRRVGSALGGGAVAGGWHSWMGGFDADKGSALTTPFGGSGIRQDVDEDELGTRRLSWTALERLAHHLGRASAGRMVHPVVDSRDALLALVESPTGPADRAVVFEYRVGSEASPEAWYYLVLLDPTVEPVDTWTDGGLRIVGAADGTELPSVQEHLFLGLNGGALSSLAGTPATRILPLTLYVDLGVAAPAALGRPRLYQSTKQLSWEAWSDGAKLVAAAPDFVLEPAVLGW